VNQAWLASLTRNNAAITDPDDGITLIALLVRAPNDRVRLLVGPLCLDFAADDIAEVREIPLPAELRLRAAIAVEVTLHPSARLLAVQDARVLQTAAAVGQLPFALATRPGRLVVPASARYAAAEADYRQRHGLTVR
jgi:hypothetical protein